MTGKKTAATIAAIILGTLVFCVGLVSALLLPGFATRILGGLIFCVGLVLELVLPKTRRIGLLVTVFLSGAALMSLEMVSFRLVQPELGGDIIVTGSMISVFLGGLALGAFLGGMMADRWPHLLGLGIILVVAGLWTLVIPQISDPVMGWVAPSSPPLPPEWGLPPDTTTGTYEAPDLRVAAIVVGLVLFGVPALLMGMVSPYSARLFVHKLPRMGTGVGLIYGVSTFGSILGTLFTTFYLMTFLGTRDLTLGNGGVLSLLGVVLVIAGLLSENSSGRAQVELAIDDT